MNVPAVRTEHLTKQYGRLRAVDDLSLEVGAGEVFGFLGPNGSGKSTTIRMLLGLARPSAGQAHIFGVPAQDVVTAHRRLAYVPADVSLWPHLTGAEILHLLAATGAGTDLSYRAELVERFALDVSKPARTLSSGNRQKVALVAAFATRAPLLVLDEPTSGLDPLMEREFRIAVGQAHERGQSVFLSSHRLDEVEALCTRIAILRAGKLIEVTSVEQLHVLHRAEVTVSYTGAPPQLDGVDGVESLDSSVPGRLTFILSGSPAAALRSLAQADVSALSMREPSLEEMFLDYYGDAVNR